MIRVGPDHEFDPGFSGLSVTCNHLVLRDGFGDDCGLPRSAHFPNASTPRPTQRPASNSEGRKRAHSAEIRPKGGLSDGGLDPHLDNGFAEVIRKAKAAAWTEGYGARWNDDRTGGFPHNPYGEAS